MPALKHQVPSYRRHKQSGQAIVTLSGRDHLLGPHGSKSSRKKYKRLVAEWLSSDREPVASDDLSVEELAARYWQHCERYYVKGGRPTSEQDCVRAALRPLLALYADEPASKFGPIKLKTVREDMIAAGLARSTINKLADRLKRMFRWAAAEELLPIETYQRLATLPGLRKGRSAAYEPEPRKPVSDQVFEATLPYLPEVVQGMARLLRN